MGFPHCFLLAGDCDVVHIKLPDVVQWDPRYLPLRSGVLDKVVTNLVQLGPSLGQARGRKSRHMKKNKSSDSSLVDLAVDKTVSGGPSVEDVYPLVSHNLNTKVGH